MKLNELAESLSTAMTKNNNKMDSGLDLPKPSKTRLIGVQSLPQSL